MTFLEVKSLIKYLMELSRCVNSLVTTAGYLQQVPCFDLNLFRIHDHFSGFKIHFEASNFLLLTTDYSKIFHFKEEIQLLLEKILGEPFFNYFNISEEELNCLKKFLISIHLYFL